MRRAYATWQDLFDRRERGEPLSPEEVAELERLSEASPEARHELEVRRQLEEFDFQLPGDSRTVVEGALAAVSSLDKVVPLRPGFAEQATSAAPRDPGGRHGLGAARRRIMAGVLVAAGVASAAVLAATLWPAERPPSKAPVVAKRQPRAVELTFTSGEVSVDGRERAVSPEALAPNSKLAVGEGRACIALDAQTDVCLSEHSSIQLDALEPGPRTVRLVEGRVAASLGRHPREERFSIVSSDTTATALGTAFAVEIREGGARAVTVLHGTVEVTEGDSASERVGPSEQVTARGRTLSEVRSVTRSEQARHWALLEPRALWKKRDVGILHLASTPVALATVDGVALGEAPLSVVLSSGEHRLRLEREGFDTLDKTVRLLPGDQTKLDLELSEGLAKAVSSSPSSSPPGARAEDLLREARALVGQGRFSDAANKYRRLRASYPRSTESHTVLVALGQLELDRLGQPARAFGSFNAYLTAPGALSQEARYGKIRASKALGNTAAERAAIEEYLKRHPRSMEAASLKRRLAELGGR